MGASDKTGNCPSDQVLFAPRSWVLPAMSPKFEGGCVRTCIWTLPSAPSSDCKVALATKSQPSTNWLGSRTGMTEGARTPRLSAESFCIPLSEPNIEDSSPHVWVLEREDASS